MQNYDYLIKTRQYHNVDYGLTNQNIQKETFSDNDVQKFIEKLRKLRKSCNHIKNVKEYTMRSCTTIASNNC